MLEAKTEQVKETCNRESTISFGAFDGRGQGRNGLILIQTRIIIKNTTGTVAEVVLPDHVSAWSSVNLKVGARKTSLHGMLGDLPETGPGKGSTSSGACALLR